MKEKRYYVVFIFIIIFLFLSTPKILLFYDAPEYIDIVSSNSFFRSLSLGHTPIHPVFIGSLWITTRLVKIFLPVSWEHSGNLSVLLFGCASILIFYKVSRILLNRSSACIAAVIFILFPAVWIISTNVMVESVSLPFYVLTVLLFFRYISGRTLRDGTLYSLCVALLVGTHLETISWLPTVFSIPLMFQQADARRKTSSLLALLGFTLIGIGIGVFLYIFIFYFSRQNIILELIKTFFSRTGEHFDFTDLGIVRMGRNIALSVFRGFGSLTGFILIYALITKKITALSFIGLVLFVFSISVNGAVWTGDFMMRRMVFAGVFISLYTVYRYPLLSKFIVLYLVPISAANFLLYFSAYSGKMPFALMRKEEKSLPKNNILIQTHYVKPFMHAYDGRILYAGQDDIASEIQSSFGSRNVYMESQAVYAPYLLYVGNNLHITSLGKFGESESGYLFDDFQVDVFHIEDADKRIYAYRLSDAHVSFEDRMKMNKKFADQDTRIIYGKAKRSPVFLYSKKISQRIYRERIDYGDVMVWIWSFITNRIEPLAWTYPDRDGVFVIPVSSKDVQYIYIRGKEIEESHIL